MGNKTYATGRINIEPALTKEDADEIEERMKSMFGAFPEWRIVKDAWEDAYLAVIGEEEWSKLSEWQEQIHMCIDFFYNEGYRLFGQIHWEDETESGILHVDSAQDRNVLNTMYVKVTCEPDWGSSDYMQVPKLDDVKGIIVSPFN